MAKPKQLAVVLFIVLLTLQATATWRSQVAAQQELPLGFKAFPDSSVSSFQPLLTDSSGNYALGFLKVNGSTHYLLSLSVIYVPSSVQLWSAATTRLARWGHPTQLSFNGSLVLSDTKSGVFWSTNSMGNRVFLSNDSNLVIITEGDGNNNNVVWQSFDFPSDTLVENQNFTSNMSLVSSNGLYSMRLGPDYIGLYADFTYSGTRPGTQIYLKHKALEAKADVIEGMPIYVILKPDGYLGMFQNGSSIPADVQSFNTFQQNATGIRRVRLETDGNLKGYYWTGSDWVMEYQAISDPCELPSSCGSYGLCRSGKGCSCLENRTAHHADDSLVCEPERNNGLISVDFCNVYENKFRIIRSNGVDLPFKELMGFDKKTSFQECEDSCEKNCSCWGVVYSNSSGFCYMIDYAIQSLISVRDDSKMGYFKVQESVGKKRMGTWLGLLLGAVLILLGVLGLGWKRMRIRRGVKRYAEEDGVVGVGPYKDLGAASFRSIELCEK